MGSYIAYIFPYIILSLFTIRHNGILRSKLPWILFYVFLCLFIGLRESIGGDWLLYNKFFIEISTLSFFDAIRYTDPAYAAINWIVGRTFGTIYIVNFICALIFFSCIFIFCSKQPYPWLCLAVLYPYLIVVVGMGYTRQSVAIGLSLLAVSFFLDGKVYKSLLVIMLSVLFHKSSLSFIPVFILGLNNKKIIFSMLLFFIAMMTYIYLFYWNHISELYIKNLVYSQGAILRVGLGIFILCLYLMVNPSPSFFLFADRQSDLLKSGAIVTCISMILVFFYPTLVDRFYLYFIYFQPLLLMLVLDRIRDSKYLRHAVTFVLSLYFFLLYIWLCFSPFAGLFWLPYKNILSI